MHTFDSNNEIVTQLFTTYASKRPSISDEEMHDADQHAQDVQRACDYLSARNCGDCYAFFDHVDGRPLSAGDEDLAELGRLLVTHPDGAYYVWIAGSDLTTLTPTDLPADFARARQAAHCDCDYATVTALDLFEPEPAAAACN